MEPDKKLTDYEQGRMDATKSILLEWSKFRWKVRGREPLMFDRADLIDAGIGRPLSSIERDDIFPRITKKDLV